MPTGVMTIMNSSTKSIIMAIDPGLDSAALLRLMTWLSPSFPVGAFSYSHGLEAAICAGIVRDRSELVDWLSELIERGSGWNDLVLAAEAWEAASDDGRILALGEVGEALAGSRERHLETMQQGEAFLDAARTWGVPLPNLARLPYPVAAGAAAGRMAIAKPAFLAAFAQAFVANLVQVAVRLVPLGQSEGLKALALLEPTVIEAGKRAATATLDDLGSSSFRADILSMTHETQYSRVFRS